VTDRVNTDATERSKTDAAMMSGADLLFEIGTEEMPAAFLRGAAAQLAADAGRLLQEARLPHDDVRGWATPRRLVLYIRGVAPRQEDETVKTRGPSRQVAFDADGRPTRAALGFARGQRVDVDELLVEATPQGEYMFAVRREEGRPAAEALGPLLASLAGGLQFPRTMRWGEGGTRFARPIRWLVALLGDEVVPVTFAGVSAGRNSFGHRFLHPGPVSLFNAAAYEEALCRARVIVDHDRRLAEVCSQVEAAARELDGQAVWTEGLGETVAFTVEYPTAFGGRIPSDFLRLPPEVLITTLEKHQFCFAVREPSGRLLPAFIAVRNGGVENLAQVRTNNERVLAARLKDAEFFYDEDIKRPLADRVQALGGVLFHEGLGTMADKAARLQRLARGLASGLALDGSVAQAAERAALLCKCDLVTNMVYEFPELQGTMGGIYARAAAEPEAEAVARAIGEQYRPRFAGDEPPETEAGSLVALADKLDSLAGLFLAGVRPSGSQDPFGLRRQAAGCVAIVARRGWDLSPRTLIDRALEGLRATEAHGRADVAGAAAEALEFLLARVQAFLEDAGLRPDVVAAVLGGEGAGVPTLLARSRSLTALLEDQGLADDILTIDRRAGRLSQDIADGPVDPGLFQEEAEQALHQALQQTKAPALQALAAGDHDRFWREVAGLRPAVDRFFDDVMVMVDEEQVRDNRLRLLRAIAGLIRRVCLPERLTVT